MTLLSLGVVGTSSKENELRAPLHPEHLPRVPQAVRDRMFLEVGYGERFGFSDAALRPLVAGLLPRAELFARCDMVLIAKPTAADFASFREGQILWGWPHLVQGPELTQVSIDKRLTWIAWEDMHHWDGDRWHLHVFHLNNELAGFSSVLHVLRLQGITGHYGPHRKAAVIGFGSVGRGAIHGLKASGYSDITLFTQRAAPAVKAPIPSVKHWQFNRVEPDSDKVQVLLESGPMSMAEALGHFDIVVNAALQDTDAPMMYVVGDEREQLRDNTVIVDVSCDAGMGFDFARPTSFEAPTFRVGDLVYYAVDHSPSYLWQSATHAISEALLPFLEPALGGPDAWAGCSTLQRAVAIQDGVIRDPKILRFQGREAAHPHRRSAT